MSVRVGVAGYGGYSGAELVRILSHHPHIEVLLLDKRDGVSGAPHHAPCTSETVKSESLNVVFLATPHEASMDLAPALLEAGTRVIDLSGAFRLKTPALYRRWYGAEHTQPAWLSSAVYGLPEFNRDAIRTASLVANPGCYPTAASLAIRPLLKHGVADLKAGIVCDAKSGVSGAGRKASLTTSFCEVTGNFSAYALLEHRHVPEVLMNCGLDEARFSFSAQLIPVDRGILETIYFRAARPLDSAALREIYRSEYAGEIFVRVHELGSFPDLRSVARSNFCDVGVHLDSATGRGVIVAAIDNLVKGAAGQAIQNMNLLLGFDESEGLL